MLTSVWEGWGHNQRTSRASRPISCGGGKKTLSHTFKQTELQFQVCSGFLGSELPVRQTNCSDASGSSSGRLQEVTPCLQTPAPSSIVVTVGLAGHTDVTLNHRVLPAVRMVWNHPSSCACGRKVTPLDRPTYD